MTVPGYLSRRRFLRIAGAAFGASAVTCSGLTALAISSSNHLDVHMIETTYGKEGTMNDKILVTYASLSGSTAGIAEVIGKTLFEGGAGVDVLPMKAVKDLTPYRAVVAGSAIHGRKWLPEAMQFLQTNRSELNRKPFAAFLVCITLGMANADQYRAGLSTWMEPVRALVKPRSEGFFAGGLDFSKLPLNSDTIGLRLAVTFGVFPKGDHRDWPAIQSWAASLISTLS
jgi:menaquinone-dependent protoporphyrinogen oxidase